MNGMLESTGTVNVGSHAMRRLCSPLAEDEAQPDAEEVDRQPADHLVSLEAHRHHRVKQAEHTGRQHAVEHAEPRLPVATAVLYAIIAP